MNQIYFEDFYEDLQISPNADQETIERVYRLLAKRFHPDSSGGGSSEKFEIITKAYKTLSDPEQRAAYDATYEQAKERQWKTHSGPSSSIEFDNEQYIRHQVLSVLYIARKQNPTNAGVGVWRLEKLLGWPETVLEFHTWYLKEKGWIQRTDTGGLAITAPGVDEIEKEGLISPQGRLLAEKT